MKIVKLEKSLTEQAYEILLDKICFGELKSGERLNQDELAKQLSVSRQPVNSAISILKSHGFVEETGRRGVIVSPISLDQFNSIYEFRSAIEPFAIKLAFERKPDTAEAEALQALDRGWAAVDKGTLKDQIEADFFFHKMVMAGKVSSIGVGVNFMCFGSGFLVFCCSNVNFCFTQYCYLAIF